MSLVDFQMKIWTQALQDGIMSLNEVRELYGLPRIDGKSFVENKRHIMDTNCPNCGAVITGPKCEYCDTRFDLQLMEVINE